MFSASSVNIRATTSTIIGSAIPNENDASSFMYSDRNTNGVIRLNRPCSNELTVDIRTLGGALWTDSAGNPIQELTFEKI